jgi:hypothetical protein
MVYVPKGKSTMKQMAYARRVFSADGVNKKQIALDVGYAPNLSRSVTTHIEETAGFHNAMARLALESNNLALAAIEEFKARGFEDFSNKEMIAALNSISEAWARFNVAPKEGGNKANNNKLRTVILQRIENQTVLEGSNKPIHSAPKEEDKPIQPDLNF